MPVVVVGLSGGVDSSVAAYLLKKEGYEVMGLFMKNWHDTTGTLSGDCPWEDDLLFAQMVAKKLQIPLHTVDLSEQYGKRVVDYMFSEYERGRTPNPDVLCNREIKFDIFMEEAFQLGCDFVATGHYSRKETITVEGKPVYRLMAGVDQNKDQSYFLCQLNQKQLEKALFPLGEITKPEVRKIANELGLATATRKDSQGVCFVGKIDLPTFLQQKIKARKGRVVEMPADWEGYPKLKKEFPSEKSPGEEALTMLATAPVYEPHFGTTIGKHNGAWFYTIGQRKGLNIGGREKPLFVIALDTEKNIVYTGQGDDHPGLNRRGLFIGKKDIHWVRPDLKLKPGESADLLVRIRYRQPLQKAGLFMRESGLFIIFRELQRGITPGQFAAWYQDEELVGSGVID
jgi:tRNA-uridine 2-sulfurtransferase